MRKISEKIRSWLAEERPDDWVPFTGRFPRADWVVWPGQPA